MGEHSNIIIQYFLKLAFIFLILTNVCSCSKINYFTHGLSQIQSPITYRQTRNYPEGTKPLSPAEGIWKVPNDDELKLLNAGDDWEEVWKSDRYSDLLGRKKLLGISLSGGGARAAYFASKVLSNIEAAYHPMSFYNEVSFYSSVSGGSIVNVYIGAWMYANDESKPSLVVHKSDERDSNWQYKPFDSIHKFMKDGDGIFKNQCGNIGDIATKVVLNPLNGGLPTLYSFFTNQGYSRHLSLSVDYCLKYLLSKNNITHYRSIQELLSDFMGNITLSSKNSAFKLADLGGHEGSRHYINSTVLETGQRLVFANKKYHIHSNNKLKQRMDDIIFLEDLYSSIKEFSIADATVASMSFPGATEPVIFEVYDGKIDKNKSPKSVAQIQIVDGGIYDNTGLSTLLDILIDEVITTGATNQELTVLLIDSDNSENINLGQFINEGQNDWNFSTLTPLNIGLSLPLKGISEGIKSALLIHDLNKRRAIRMMFYDAYNKLNKLNESGRQIKLKVIPISIAILNTINNKTKSDLTDNKKVKDIATYYSISNDEIDTIERSVETLFDVKYSDILTYFRKRYFLPQDLYIDNLLYQYDGSATMKEVLVKAISTDRSEIEREKIAQKCQKMKDAYGDNAFYLFAYPNCKNRERK